MRIVEYIGDDKQRFDELMDLFFNDVYHVGQRAAWVVSYCAKPLPELIHPYIKKC